MAEEFDSTRDERKPLDAVDGAQIEASVSEQPATDVPGIPLVEGETAEQYSRKTFEEAKPPFERNSDPDAPEPQRRRGDEELRGRPANMYSRPERRDASQGGGQQRRNQSGQRRPQNGQGRPQRKVVDGSKSKGKSKNQSRNSSSSRSKGSQRGGDDSRRRYYDQYDRYSKSSSKSKGNARRNADRNRYGDDIHSKYSKQHSGRRRGAGTAARERQRKQRNPKGIIIGIVIILILVLGTYIGMGSRKVDITVNGKQMEVAARTTYEKLHEDGFITDDPGDFVAVDGSVLETGQGQPVTVLDGGEVVEKLTKRVHDGSVITQDRGANIEEESTTSEGPEEASVIVDGGAENFNFYNKVLHVKAQEGQDGVAVYKTGTISGKTAVDHETTPMKNAIWTSIDPESYDDEEKVIALTFDDGPHPEYTDQVLAVLAKYNAKATFFELGENAEEYPEISKRVVDAGHQLASHTYSHDPDNYLNKLDAEGVQNQITKAQTVLENATGVHVTCVRPPGGNIDGDAVLAAGNLCDSFVGWSIDSVDWQLPGADTIIETVEDAATSGSIILMHDGGGNREETVEAIESIIPDLQAKGYRFVTIDELIELRRPVLDKAVHSVEVELGIASDDEPDEANAKDEG